METKERQKMIEKFKLGCYVRYNYTTYKIVGFGLKKDTNKCYFVFDDNSTIVLEDDWDKLILVN